MMPQHSMMSGDGLVSLGLLGDDNLDLVRIVKRIIYEATETNRKNSLNNNLNNNLSNEYEYSQNNQSLKSFIQSKSSFPYSQPQPQLYYDSGDYNNNNNNTNNGSISNLNSNFSNFNTQFTQTKHLNEKDLALIMSLNEEQVENLLSSEEKFNKFMNNFNQDQDQSNLIKQMKLETLDIAKNNLILKKEIDELAKILNSSLENYSQALQSYKNFLVLNSSSLKNLQPENLMTQLQVNLMELDDQSNKSIKCLLNSKSDNLDLELKECIKLRKEYHRKSILLQKYN